MHPPNQSLRKPDKLSQGAHSQTSYPRVQQENTLDKKGLQNPSKESEKRQEEREKEREEKKGTKDIRS